MDPEILQKLFEWENACAKGNTVPETAREFLPARPTKDIALGLVKPVKLQKYGQVSTKTTPAPSKPDPKMSTTTEPESSTASTDAKSQTASPKASRKEYYESWDRFDVDKALEDMDNKPKGKSTKPLTASEKKSAKPAPAPASSTSVDIAAANTEKEKGNEFFKKGQYQRAIEHYSASMALDPSNSVLPINRAMALLKLERYSEAERDCTLGLQLDKKNVKALWRRGIARRSLGKFGDARKDFEYALTLDPVNKAVKDELAKLPSQEKQPSSTGVGKQPASTKESISPGDSTLVSPLSSPTNALAKATTSDSSKRSPAKPKGVISSKRVVIEEIEDDHESDLFSPPPSAKNPPSLTSTPPATQPTPDAAPTSTPSVPSPAPSNTTTLQASSSSSSTADQIPVGSKEQEIVAKMKAPITTLDFQRDWKSYSKNNQLLYHYIKLIQPESLPGLFKSSFESDYFSSMLTVYRELYITSEEPELLFRSLTHLAKVQRFDMTLMFMTGTDKKDLSAIFKYLAAHSTDSNFSQQEVASLAAKYKTSL
ncbi:RNA polymerase II-associated protein 3 [Lunasporangiospora selenospora]|uniref:RNA polymerase II-associated protein 3 n=1 Tax=Lunasporangiospora selenospora TaxID=979761 RepID=A0A9P6FWU7_9FUNG|nr:RNA polymerase II-associated protein 3 [Lunasporangiospora selenospora]